MYSINRFFVHPIIRHLLQRPTTNTVTASCAFAVAALRIWNSLPVRLSACINYCTFKTKLKGTLHSILTLGFFSLPKSVYYFDLSLKSFTFVKSKLRVQGTHFYGDAGEFDGRCGINLVIWSQWWSYHKTDD